MPHRHAPRVILRRSRRGTFEEVDALVIEMGLGGAKFEHEARLDVGRVGKFSCGPLTTQAVVRHSVLLPTPTGLVYQSGVGFPDLGESEKALLFDLLVREAKEQVIEWESNLAGDAPTPMRVPTIQSAVAPRFISLKLATSGWQRLVTTDPNQPIDGVTIIDGTSAEEVAMLQKTYEAADPPTRELMRRIATVAILERLRG